MFINKPLCRHNEMKEFCKFFEDGNCKLNIKDVLAPCEHYLKNKPLKPIYLDYEQTDYDSLDEYRCPICGNILLPSINKYCDECGQEIDWS